MPQDYKPMDFNRRGRDIFNDNQHARCPWCHFNVMIADDLVDAGERENNHTCLLQVIEDAGGSDNGVTHLSFQWECLNCHKNGMFQRMGPRTDDDMVRKQNDAMQRKHKSERGES